MPRTWHVAQRSPAASDTNSGSATKPFRSIAPAAAQARPGDTVLVHPGIYRERVMPARGGEPGQPITYAAAIRHQAVICGSDVFTGAWKAVSGAPRLFRAEMKRFIGKRFNPFATNLQRRDGQCLGQVIVDGVVLVERINGTEVERLAGSWRALDGGAAILVHLPEHLTRPQDALVELTVRQRVFSPVTRGLSHIVVRGFTLQHAANNYCTGFWENEFPQMGLIGCRSGHHWEIDGNLIRHAKTFALDIGFEGPNDHDGLNQPPGLNPGYHLIHNNHITSNGCGAILGCVSPGCRILHNVIDNNEVLGTSADESAGIKLHFCYDTLIEGNLIKGNDCPGIWVDNNWRGARITRNVIIDNAGAGIFCELGDGPLLIDNNVIAYTRGTMAMAGDGIYAHDASGVTVAHNLLWFNSNFALWTHVGSDRQVNFFRVGTSTPPPSRGDKLPGLDTLWPAHLHIHHPHLTWEDRPAESSRWTVVNNLVFGNSRGTFSLPPEQPLSSGIVCNHNVVSSGYDLVISETWGSPLDQPLFMCNTNKERVALSELAKRLVDALPSGQRPDPVKWQRLPVLQLAQWQALTGHDRQSRIPIVLRPRLALGELVVEFIIDDAARAVACARVSGVDRDWSGAAYGRKPLAGPFQDLQVCAELSATKTNYHSPHRGPYEKLRTPSHINTIPLWPIARQGTARV